MGESAWKVEVLLQGNWRRATSVLLSNGGHSILVDTGMAHDAHQLLQALEERGRKPQDIGALIITHFHVDHVLNNSLFPLRTIYATQQSYDWCRSLYSDLLDNARWERLALKYYPETFEYERVSERMRKLRKLALRWWDPKRLGAASQFCWIEKADLPEGLESFITHGHVPGHASLIVRDAENPTVIAADALLTREHDERVLTMIPHNRAEYHRDRARILSMRSRVIPGHDREFDASRATAEGQG